MGFTPGDSSFSFCSIDRGDLLIHLFFSSFCRRFLPDGTQSSRRGFFVFVWIIAFFFRLRFSFFPGLSPLRPPGIRVPLGLVVTGFYFFSASMIISPFFLSFVIYPFLAPSSSFCLSRTPAPGPGLSSFPRRLTLAKS